MSTFTTLDSRLSQRLSQWAEASPLIRKAAIGLAHSGDSPFWIGVLLFLWWRGATGWKFEALAYLAGILLTGLVVQLIKLSVRRPRPAGEWGQGYRKIDPHSFPSGHAARAIMLAAIASFLGPVWWAAILWVWAPLVGAARVMLRVHYVSDIAAGAACGILCGLSVGWFATRV